METISRLFCLLLSCSLFSQEIYKPVLTPNASEMFRMNANEVNFFTGTPQVVIPLESFEVDNFKLNIALNYNTGGIRVSQNSNSVGLGWYLMAGGSISRQIKGQPDETYRHIDPTQPVNEKKGWFHSDVNIRDLNLWNYQNMPTRGNMPRSADFRAKFDPLFLTGGEYNAYKKDDTEPDIFEFNFNGKSGKFIFDNVNGVVSIHQVPWTGLKIEYVIEEQIQSGKKYNDFKSFTITDIDNTKYFFEAHETTNQVFNAVDVAFVMVRESDDPDIGNAYGWDKAGGTVINHDRTSWFLTKVITSNGKVVTFEYEDEMINMQPEGMQARGRHFKTYRSQSEEFYVVRDQSVTILLKRLSKIRLPEATIEFVAEAAKPQTDHNRGRAIKEMNIYRPLELLSPIKKIGLEYGFSTSDGIESATQNKKGNYRRMILTEIKRYYSPTNLSRYQSYKLYYDLQNFGNSNLKLPHNNSYAVDQWGFYNGANQNISMIPKMYIYPSIPGSESFRVEKLNQYTGAEYIFEGADRTPNEVYMGVGMLNKIIYPTGGSVNYEYEPNEYMYRNQRFLGPGLRIKKITNNDGKKSEVYQYDYKDKNGLTSGRVIGMPIMGRIISHFPNYQEYTRLYYERNMVVYSDTQMELSSIDSRLIGYSTVSEIRAGRGKVVNTFSLNGTIEGGWDAHVDDDGQCTNPNSIGYCDGFFENPVIFHLSYGSHATQSDYMNAFNLDQPVKNTFPFPPAPNYDWNRGLLLSREVFNEEGDKLQRTINVYENYTPYLNHTTRQPYNVYGLKIEQIVAGRPGAPDYSVIRGVSFRASKYKIITDIAKVNSMTIDSIYFPSKKFPPIVSRKSFTYGSRFHSFPTRIAVADSKRDEIVTEYQYPPDLWNDADPDAAIFEDMDARNMIAFPITIREKVNNVVVSETFNEYAIFGNTIQKSAEYKKKGTGVNINSLQDRKVVYNRYDSRGNILEYTFENNIPVAIIWGYDDKYPVLKVEGATYNQVLSILSNEIEESIIDGTIDSNSFAGLRSALPNAQITNYTFTPIFGVTSITDPKGDTLIYQYDSFGRLEFVKDKDGRVLSENQYNYKQ